MVFASSTFPQELKAQAALAPEMTETMLTTRRSPASDIGLLW
jgi:hypothetical protein